MKFLKSVNKYDSQERALCHVVQNIIRKKKTNSNKWDSSISEVLGKEWKWAGVWNERTLQAMQAGIWGMRI